MLPFEMLMSTIDSFLKLLRQFLKVSLSHVKFKRWFTYVMYVYLQPGHSSTDLILGKSLALSTGPIGYAVIIL